ncbi:unnamed protein product [Rotaria socialis]|uniref:Endonuclease/exonuclease/phosphatase domain-containing protein n=1 Tax=Rotaria socialis TaxID=392032 RepID=A0A818EG66_9BILA|nr:unnamed protein product [Rotaria socialis]
MDDELYNLKQEHEIEIKKLKTEHETQKQEMTQSWQLINLQFKTQAEAIVDIYTTISEILPPVVQSLQTINQVIEEINRNVIDENERQRKQIIFTTIKETIFSLNSRLCLLTDHQQKLKTLMDKKNNLLLRGMNPMNTHLMNFNFNFSSPIVNKNVADSFESTKTEKDRPDVTNENLSLIIYNCQCLSTHIADIDILLSIHIPQLLILTGVGSKIRNLPKITSYHWISQEGINSFGEVAILLHDTLKTKVITRELDFLMVELDILPRSILLGAVHVPPSKPIHQYLFDKYVSKSFYIFGDFNAKHTDWLCSNNNASGVQMKTWLENTGCEMIYPNQPTSKRSSAVIDFGIAHNAYGWKADVIKEGRSGKNWKRAQQKKSTDTEGISAFLLHQLPTEYLQIVTIAFNKIAQSGIVLRKSKHAKVICLSKDGLYPAVDKLRPISLLSNFGKCFERIIHTRILKWCNDKGIFTDEQSGFTSERRLQARILSLVEDLRLTTAANNRPSLVIFVDFVSAFDKNVAPCTSYHTSQTRHSVTTTTVDFSVAQRKNNVNPCWRSGFTCSQHLCWQTSRFSPCRYSFSSTCPFPPIIFYEPSLPLICGRSGYNYL